jgi:hypothetical protein
MEAVYAKYKNPDGSLSFLSPSGVPITIKEPIISVSFCDFNDDWYKSGDFTDYVLPIGTLEKFTLANGVTYIAGHPGEEKDRPTFNGYYQLGVNGKIDPLYKIYKDTISKGKNYKNIVVGIPAIENSDVVFKVIALQGFNYTAPIDNTSYASGEQKDVFFIKDYINDVKSGINVASTLPKFSTNELEFINTFSDGNIYGINALYAIRILYFIKYNPDLLNCLGDAANKTGDIENTQSVALIQKKINNLKLHIVDADNTKTDKTYFVNIKQEVSRETFTTTQYLKTLHDVMYGYYQALKKQSAISITMSISDLDEVTKLFGRECLIRNIPIATRLKLLENYKTWSWSGDKEKMLLDLILHVKSSDIPALLDGLAKDDNKTLWGLYEDDNSKSAYNSYLAALSAYVLEQKQNSTEAKALKGTWQQTNSKHINVCKQSILFTLCGVEVFKNTKGKLVFSFSNYANFFNEKKISENIEVSPYELVRVRFEDDFSFSGLNQTNIKKGEEAIIPAIYLFWIVKQQEDIRTNSRIRIWVDILAIAVGLGTGQLETIEAVDVAAMELSTVAIVDASAAGADIAFQLASDKIRSADSKIVKEILADWDAAYSFYALGRITTDVAKIVFTPDALRKAILNIKENAIQLKNTGQALYRLYKVIKNSQSISIKGTSRTILLREFYAASIECTLKATCSRGDEVAMLFQNDKIVVGVQAKLPTGGVTTTSTGVSIANVAMEGNTDALTLSNVRWLPSTVRAEKVVELIKNVNIAIKGVQSIEIVSAANGQYYAREVKGAGKFIAKSGEELKIHLNTLQDIPNLEKYSGNFYRTVGNGRDPLLTHYIPKGQSQRYSKSGEDGLFFSSSKEGNFLELHHWSVPIEGNTTTFLYKDVISDGLLDLTNPFVREKLGINISQITTDSYEFTDVLGTWARNKNYNGIIYPSARGTSENLYFINVILFDSKKANSVIQGKELEKKFN